MRFTLECQVPVRSPYRLDYTADALRRLAANVVDIVDQHGTYRRAVRDEHGINLIEVSQPGARSLHVRLAGKRGERWIPALHRMLGTDVRLDQWYDRVTAYPWLARLTQHLKGLRPPRYPSLFEALAHSIVFQQISIHAAASIMRRTIEALSDPIDHGGVRYYPFVLPEKMLHADDALLRSCGLSQNKIAHLRSAAQAVAEGAITAEEIEALPSVDAAERLRSVRGIGPWSAAVVLLRGFGRLDVFPLKDSGVARSLRLLSGDPALDANALLEHLGPVRGMLYFHLLLGRIRGLV